jgi:tetratricopeptide (TPR) repeat protein
VVRIWDPTTGQEALALRGHTGGPVWAVAYSPDGTRLASAGADGAVRIWDLTTGQDALALRGHTGGPVWAVAYSPDGTRLASAGIDGVVRIWDSTPITQESLARDDALRLIRLLLERVTSAAELRDRIAGDKTISKETREAALELAKVSWPTRIRGQAESLVSSLFARLLLRADVVASVHADPALKPEVRVAALALAETWPESKNDLYNAAFELVKLPNRPEEYLRRGLRLAEAAIRIEPDNGYYLNALGVAQYRMGQYGSALATLERSNRLDGNREPADLAFLAMAQHHLNRVESARVTLDRLREVMRDPRIAGIEENQIFLRETESVILGSADLPSDVFGR